MLTLYLIFCAMTDNACYEFKVCIILLTLLHCLAIATLDHSFETGYTMSTWQ